MCPLTLYVFVFIFFLLHTLWFRFMRMMFTDLRYTLKCVYQKLHICEMFMLIHICRPQFRYIEIEKKAKKRSYSIQSVCVKLRVFLLRGQYPGKHFSIDIDDISCINRFYIVMYVCICITVCTKCLVHF